MQWYPVETATRLGQQVEACIKSDVLEPEEHAGLTLVSTIIAGRGKGPPKTTVVGSALKQPGLDALLQDFCTETPHVGRASEARSQIPELGVAVGADTETSHHDQHKIEHKRVIGLYLCRQITITIHGSASRHNNGFDQRVNLGKVLETHEPDKVARASVVGVGETMPQPHSPFILGSNCLGAIGCHRKLIRLPPTPGIKDKTHPWLGRRA